ncbi:hypothetical protein J2X97_002163 [Epilithonimonas hungarica]|uniref:hypothetical protein n=1 Tax=Epilithonimonas hungarica TaxID=454006 RepID=UPI002788C06C|nr:hypothetical protein [Epilithonimonas hungarica]MDP9956504.1 hypothetical protein [Epilithonimonas hungarica]
MKTNLMAILALSIFLLSCSRSEDTIEETTQETPFFNLKVGNEWVYKTYDRQDFTSELKFNGKIDTLKIVEEVSLNNKKYAKVRHSYKDNPNQNQNYEYWRLNNKGHLVSLSSYHFNQGTSSDNLEIVKHTGKDFDYSYTDLTFSNYGNITYKLYPDTSISINNQAYTVSPYNGHFIPNAQNPHLISKVVENNYKEGLGLVKSVCHSVTGTYNFEEHLISYSLK